jgi:hypothetical protein
VFPPCATCQDTTHPHTDCPTRSECDNCGRTGHLSVHCCAREHAAAAEEPDAVARARLEPLREVLPEGLASQMLAGVVNQPWGPRAPGAFVSRAALHTAAHLAPMWQLRRAAWCACAAAKRKRPLGALVVVGVKKRLPEPTTSPAHTTKTLDGAMGDDVARASSGGAGGGLLGGLVGDYGSDSDGNA